MTNETSSGEPEQTLGDGELRFYARSYMAQKTADENFLRWESCHTAAILLDREPDRPYPDYGLNGRQLAEGARIAARRMALLLAEAPTGLREVLARKIHTFEAMAPLQDEGTRSNAIFMIEGAMKRDAEQLGIVLLPLSNRPGRAQ
ncbi:hypothetical protein [Bosea sp. BH3]|uniref:hypothetical protein n=1 Tax=Bosea sp. BH3 TaxID=2871701 RepID=UPI0021CB0646|nr:hypothetical protein [Bosea sp. BH3]MCU4178625.1 hypothetical protein [Bosea sp. BH3]